MRTVRGQISPIALFAYNRPLHLRQTVEALQENEGAGESDLVVFSDGARLGGQETQVAAVRSYLPSISGFRSVRIVEHAENRGLAASIISGVTSMVREFGRVIVLEDDMVTSKYFLRYMNEALQRYQDDDRVISAHGYCYPIPGLPETFFLKGADCWGWGTWERGWTAFEPDGRALLNQLRDRGLLARFDFYGGYNYSGMLRRQIRGKNQSWAVRWYAAALLKDKLTLYPGRSLVQPIGLEGSGVHCGKLEAQRVFEIDAASSPIRMEGAPVEESTAALASFRSFLASTRGTMLDRVKRRFKRIAGRVGALAAH